MGFVFFVFFPSSLSSAVTYQSSENNRVAGGMQGGVEDLSVKSRRERRIDSESADGDKSKTKPRCFFILLCISTFKDWISAGTCFLYLIEDVQDEMLKRMRTVQKYYLRAVEIMLQQPELIYHLYKRLLQGN